MAKHRIVFSKEGKARYISHLDLMRTMQRAFLRAGIHIHHTEGFHPHPYISMPLPLPLFFSSECEVLEFGIVDGATVDTLPSLMNQALPDGITVQHCYEDGLPFRRLNFVRYEISMDFDTALAEEAATALRELISRESLVITKRSKKAKSGQTELDIIPQIHALESLNATGDRLEVQILLHAQNPGLNPDLLVGAFRVEYPALAPSFVRFHRLALLDDTMAPYR